MSILVVLAHPDPASFNHAIAKTATETLTGLGHKVVFHDLYAEKFEPILPAREIPEEAQLDATIKNHCQELREADGIVIVHPNWWGQPPAILTGWIDRVVRAGVAYRFEGEDGGEGVPVGLLKAKKAVVFNTANTPPKREKQVFGDPLEAIWRNCIFSLCGVKHVYRKTFSIVITSSELYRKKWLTEVSETLKQTFA